MFDSEGLEEAVSTVGEVLADQGLTYEVVPQSGSGELAGVSGRLTMEVVEKVHHHTLVYEVPGR